MTRTANPVDAARVELLLTELRLPGVKAIWPRLKPPEYWIQKQFECLSLKPLTGIWKPIVYKTSSDKE